MNNSNNISDDLKKIAPKLSEIRKITPFKVPDQYFEQLPYIIQAKCIESKSSKYDIWTWIRESLLEYKYAASVSLAMVVLGLGLIFYKYFFQQQIATQTLTSLTPTEVNNFVSDNINLFDEEMISELCYVDESNLTQSEDTENQDKQLEEYIFNNIDENTIQEELL